MGGNPYVKIRKKLSEQANSLAKRAKVLATFANK